MARLQLSNVAAFFRLKKKKDRTDSGLPMSGKYVYPKVHNLGLWYQIYHDPRNRVDDLEELINENPVINANHGTFIYLPKIHQVIYIVKIDLPFCKNVEIYTLLEKAILLY